MGLRAKTRSLCWPGQGLGSYLPAMLVLQIICLFSMRCCRCRCTSLFQTGLAQTCLLLAGAEAARRAAVAHAARDPEGSARGFWVARARGAAGAAAHGARAAGGHAGRGGRLRGAAGDRPVQARGPSTACCMAASGQVSSTGCSLYGQSTWWCSDHSSLRACAWPVIAVRALRQMGCSNCRSACAGGLRPARLLMPLRSQAA